MRNKTNFINIQGVVQQYSSEFKKNSDKALHYYLSKNSS